MSSLRRFSMAALLAVFGGTAAYAASFTVGGGSLGMAATRTPRCTNSGLGVIQNIAGSNVISVTVGNLPAACGSATIQAAVKNAGTSSSGSATVPAGGGSVTVTLGAAVAIGTVEEIDLVLTGP